MISKDNFLVFGSPAIEESEIDEVVDSLKSGWLGTGPKVARFEQEFSAYKGLSENSVAAVNSCTAALHVSMIAAGLKHGDEVITSAMTFCATVNAIIHSGATPVLADIDPLTMNIDPKEIEAKITPRTKAIIPVHFAGRPCDMEAIMALSQKYNLKIIEDCAHAIESEYKGKKTGTFGDFGCFSFYVTKNMTTGEGGMVVAKQPNDIEKIKVLSLHGMSKDAWHRFSDKGYKHYYVVEAGFKYNMMDIQAAIGIHQLKRIDENWKKRKAIWDLYQRNFADLPLNLPAEPTKDMRHAYHLYNIRLKNDSKISRDELLDFMTEKNIGVGVHYLSMAAHPYYQSTYGWKPEDYPNAMNTGRTTVSLPLAANLEQRDIERVISAVQSICG